MSLHFNISEKNILIVDDNATNILLIEAILEEEGFANTFSATSAIDAYEVLDTTKIDAILMDIIMPEIDGLEATEAIKSNKRFSHIPIIMVTATDDDKLLKKSFELGAVDFVRKPVNQVELIARLNTILQSQEKDALIMQHSRFDAMEEMIGMLAHQWRQPLSIVHAIISTIQTQKELGILNDEELNTSLESIIKHTNDLSEMITTFREFFKSNNTPKLANANDAILESVSLLKEGLENESIALDLQLDELEPIFYIQNLLIQVLTNVIINAKEAHALHKVDKPSIIINSYKQGNKINILVEDNAGGIEEDLIGYIFEPYFSTKQEKNGKGLGLYLAKTILTHLMEIFLLLVKMEKVNF
ncbi:MAG TPA: hybrid sensor histidine kinase/response regulator [Sulfurimonas sp.]|nr:hybrid sensor histidine kinase/response regulator [Sulfurimonas sp.]